MCWKTELIEKQVYGGELYTTTGLQKALYALGHSVPMDDLYAALKGTGWIKLRLIRDRLLDTKRAMPKRTPFDGVRHLIKWPLLVNRDEDLPEWKKYSGSNTTGGLNGTQNKNHRLAFEEADTRYGDVECFARLLYYITEHFGMVGSKHDARRIKITTGGEDEQAQNTD